MIYGTLILFLLLYSIHWNLVRPPLSRRWDNVIDN